MSQVEARARSSSGLVVGADKGWRKAETGAKAESFTRPQKLTPDPEPSDPEPLCALQYSLGESLHQKLHKRLEEWDEAVVRGGEGEGGAG